MRREVIWFNTLIWLLLGYVELGASIVQKYLKPGEHEFDPRGLGLEFQALYFSTCIHCIIDD